MNMIEKQAQQTPELNSQEKVKDQTQFDNHQDFNFTKTDKSSKKQSSFRQTNYYQNKKENKSNGVQLTSSDQKSCLKSSTQDNSILKNINQQNKLEQVNIKHTNQSLVQQYTCDKINQNSDKQIQNTSDENRQLSDNQKSKIDKIFSQSKISEKYKQQLLYSGLLKKNYILENYLSSGGQADVFEGYQLNNQGMKQQQYAFKIYFREQIQSNKQFQQEKEILQYFKKAINVVKFIDWLEIEQFSILVLEKCEYCLSQELKQFKEKKQEFSFEKLLKIIFDLLDGLIELRIHNILHLDIKPANILKSKQGYYCYSDFGTSFYIKNKQDFQINLLTKKFASPEQLNKQTQSLWFQSDVYSLGITFKIIIDTFRDVNKEYISNNIEIRKIINNFEQFILQNMILKEQSQRSNCQKLYKLFLHSFQIEKHEQSFLNYKNKLNELNQNNTLYENDLNKDIPFYLYNKYFKNFINLGLLENHINLNLIEYENKNKNNLQISKIQDNQNKLDQFANDDMQRQLKQNQLEKAVSLQNIGQSFLFQGCYQKGVEYSQESLKIFKIFQGNKLDIAQSLDNLGSCIMQCFKRIGFKYLLESLDMINQIYKVNFSFTEISINERWLKELLIVFVNEIYEENNPDITLFLKIIGECLMKLNDYSNALNILLVSLKKIKQIFQENHLEIAKSLNNIGICFLNLQDFYNGLIFFFESLKIRKQIFHGNYPGMATSLHGIGQCFIGICEKQKGLNYLLESLLMRKQIFQGNHPDIASSLCVIGELYINLGNKQKGEKYLLKSVEMIKQIFQGHLPEILTNLIYIGVCYLNLDNNQNEFKYSFEQLIILNNVCHDLTEQYIELFSLKQSAKLNYMIFKMILQVVLISLLSNRFIDLIQIIQNLKQK